MGSANQVDPADRLIVNQLRVAGAEAYVSGAELAEQLGITRAAVGKRVNVLREQGFTIDAVPRLGYKLGAEPEGLHPLVVEGGLTTEWVGRAYLYRHRVGSTNAELAKAAGDGAPEGAVVLAEEQSGGRGRLGRSWESRPGENLTFSLLLRPACVPAGLPPISLAAAVGVARGIEPFLDFAPIVKWPNDILTPDGRKLCGILTELAAEIDRVQHVVVGVGLNVNQTRFSRSIRSIASSLKAITGKSVSRADVFFSVLSCLEDAMSRLLFEGDEGVAETLAEWLSLAPWIGEEIQVVSPDQEFTAIATGLDTTGALVLEIDGEENTLLSADIRLKL